jgi:hypothetical protein
MPFLNKKENHYVITRYERERLNRIHIHPLEPRKTASFLAYISTNNQKNAHLKINQQRAPSPYKITYRIH